MKPILEYIINKSTKRYTIKATNQTIKKMVIEEIKRLGHDADLNHIDVSECTIFGKFDGEKHLGLFNKLDFYGDVSKWNVSNVKDMSCTFFYNNKFNCPLNDWDVSHVEDMYCMFLGCTEFDQPLNKWDVSNVNNAYEMFTDCESFNQDLSMWKFPNGVWTPGIFNNCPIKEEYKPKFN